MKTNPLFRSLLLAGTFACTTAAAQPAAPPAAGYWNVETNLTTRDYTIVRFYNAQDQLVYEERIDDLCLNLCGSRPVCQRTKARLDAALQQVLHDPSLAARAPALLAQQLRANRRVQRVYAVR